jgi:hypothetical protein
MAWMLSHGGWNCAHYGAWATVLTWGSSGWKKASVIAPIWSYNAGISPKGLGSLSGDRA